MIHLILQQSYLHLFSYTLVLVIVFVAVADAMLIQQLRRLLGQESSRLRAAGLTEDDLQLMLHPAAVTLRKPMRGASELRRNADLADASLFLPIRARMMLTRDLSTLMGLIATLLALVAAASD